MICKCYDTRKHLIGWADADTPVFGETYGVCLGTKEVDRCTCNGDESLCDFYPNVLKVARERREEEQKQKEIKKLRRLFQNLTDYINNINNEVQSM